MAETTVTQSTNQPSERQKKWIGRLRLAQRYQDEQGNQRATGPRTGGTGSGDGTSGRWEKFRKAYAGDFNSYAELGAEAIDVNLIYANCKTTLPPLWLQEPYVAFKPTRKTIRLSGKDVDNIGRVQNAELETNYWLKELDFRQEVLKPCVIDAELTNHGYAYVGYTTEEKDIKSEDGEVVQPNPLVKVKAPFILRICPKDILLPPGKWKLDHCEWMAIKWVLNYEDALTRYNKTEEELPATHSLNAAKLPDDSEDLKEYLDSHDAKKVEIYQIWCKRTGMIYDVADGCEDILDEQDWTIETEGFPVVDISFVDVPDDYYGSPSVQYYYPQNKELNAARTQMRKRFNRSKKTVFVSSDVADEVKEEYKAAPDGSVISTGLPGDQDVRKHIYTDEGLQQDQGALTYEARIQNDIRQLAGESSNQRASGDPNVDTATESANIDKYVQVRATDKGDRVRTFTLTVARKLYMVCQQLPDTKRSMLIAGEQAGRYKEIEYSTKEIVGEFALELDVSSFMSENPQTRLAMATQNYNLLRGDPLVNPETLILDVMKAQNKPNPEQYLLALREPQEEFQALLQGMPVEPHPKDAHEEHMREHEKQAQTLEKRIEGAGDPQEDEARTLRVTLTLLMAHMNAHTAMLMKVQEAQGRQAGSPIDTNKYRNTQAVMSGRETAAEMGGNPVN